jgi:hypothetical protein
MTAAQSGKSPRHARRLSTGHGTAHSNIQLSPQIAQQFMMLDAARSSFINRFILVRLVASARFQSASSPAAPKSP